MKARFCKGRQPKGDLDCRVGVKRSTNQQQSDGSKKEIKEYLWGYGSGVASITTPDYGDMVLAEETLGFHQAPITHFRPLSRPTAALLHGLPPHITAAS